MSNDVDPSQFLSLIRDYLGRCVAVEEFCARFVSLWVRRRDVAFAREQDWQKPAGRALIEAHKRGELPQDVFDEAWAKLWGYDPVFQAMIDAVHSSCSAYRPEPESAWEISQEQMRLEVEQALSEYRERGGSVP